MIEEDNGTLSNNELYNDFIEVLSQIQTIISSNTVFSELKDFSGHYLCSKCHFFPKLILKENTNIQYKCQCKDLKNNISLKEYPENKITEENIINYTKCDCKSNKLNISFCKSCQKNLCEKCYKDHKINNHDIIMFDQLNNKIKDIEYSIIELLKPIDRSEILTEIKNTVENFFNTQSKNERGTNTNVIKLEQSNPQDNKNIDVKKECEMYFNNYNNNNNDKLNLLFGKILVDKKLFPNYINYENIYNIFFFYMKL